MSDKPFDSAAYVDQAAAALGLTIDPAYRPGVIDNVATLHRVAQLVMSYPLPEDVEAGPVFEP